MLVQIEVMGARQDIWQAVENPVPVEETGFTGTPQQIANDAALEYLRDQIAANPALDPRVRAALYEDDGSRHRSGPDMDWTYSAEVAWDVTYLTLPHEVDGLPLAVDRWSRQGDLDADRWIEVSRTAPSYNAYGWPRARRELHTQVALCGMAGGQAQTLFSVSGWGAHPTVEQVLRMARMAIAGWDEYGDAVEGVPVGADNVDLLLAG